MVGLVEHNICNICSKTEIFY